MCKYFIFTGVFVLSVFVILNCTNPEEPPTPTPISVVTPNSNTVWYHYDTNLAITWTGYNSSYIDIDLYHSDTLFLEIADGIENDGGYILNGPISSSWPQDANYYIRLVDGTGTVGISDCFSVTECTGSEIITISQPAAGDEWQHFESGYSVIWNYPGAGKNTSGTISVNAGNPLAGETVDIELWNDGEKVVILASGISNDLSWTLSEPVSSFWGIDSTFQIKIKDDLNNYGYSSEFSLIPCDDPEVIDVTEPASGTIMEHYETGVEVKWEYQGDLEGDSIMIDIYDDTAFVSSFSEEWVPNNGSYIRTSGINPRWGTGSTYRLRVYDNQYCYGWSDEFEIANAEAIDITEPDSDTEWMHFSEDQSIRWDASILDSDSVEISLYKDQTLVETLVSSSENTGEWTFAGPVPEEWTVGEDYEIYIVDEYGDYGWSDEFSVSLSSGADVIVVTEPDNTTSWTHFETGYSIEWHYAGQTLRLDTGISRIAARAGFEPLSGDSVRIELLKNGAFVTYLSNWVDNTGEYELTMMVSGDWNPGIDYKVRVVDNLDNYGMSEEFEIEECSGQEIITVTVPADTTVWKHYETGAEVYWEYPAILSGDSIMIEVYDDIGSTYIGGFTDDWISNSGSFTRSKMISPSWGTGDEFRVKVIDELGNYGWSAAFEIEPDEVIEVLVPTSETQWMHYSIDNTVRWDTTGVLSDSVTISVYKDNVFVETLTATTLNTGEWTYPDPVPGAWAADTTYQIYIEDNYSDYGWSQEFEVAAASGQNVIVVTTPDSNSVWTHFISGYPIDWEYSTKSESARGITASSTGFEPLAGDSVRIELLDNSVHVAYLSEWIPNTGAYELMESVSMNWGTGNQYQIEIVDNTANYGMSEEFRIVNSSHQEVITITEPTAETGWEHYEKNTEVTWEYPAILSGDSVLIELYDGATYIADYSDGWIANDGSYIRTAIIDPTWGAGKHYNVKVVDNYANYGVSAEFKVNNTEVINVTQPDSASVWMHTSSFHTIRWDTTGIFSHDMTIEIFREDTVLVETLVTGTMNDGEWIYAGPVPESWTPGDDYYISITDNYSDYGYSTEFPVIAAYPDSVSATLSVDGAPWKSCSLPDGSYVYVPCSADSSVFVIDTHGNVVEDSITVGASPVECCTKKQGDYVYVSDAAGDSVYVIRTANNSVYDVIDIGAPSSGLCTEPRGDFLYVSIPSANEIAVIRLPQNNVIATITTGGEPNRICALSTEDYLYVTIASSNIVSVIDTETNTVVENINIGYVPDDICALPLGDYVYVTTIGVSTPVVVIRTSDNTVVQEIAMDEDNGICAMSSGDYVYVTQESLGMVKIIRTYDYQIVGTISVGFSPAAVCVLPSDEHLYVSNKGERTISVIE